MKMETLSITRTMAKNQMNIIIMSHKKCAKKSTFFKWSYGHSGNDYKVSTQS